MSTKNVEFCQIWFVTHPYSEGRLFLILLERSTHMLSNDITFWFTEFTTFLEMNEWINFPNFFWVYISLWQLLHLERRDNPRILVGHKSNLTKCTIFSAHNSFAFEYFVVISTSLDVLRHNDHLFTPLTFNWRIDWSILKMMHFVKFDKPYSQWFCLFSEFLEEYMKSLLQNSFCPFWSFWENHKI